jgi:hypothetical protein|tara:strand:- start:89 stop:697 length:609 start_codon:yes stop_codon:yes gene_type:complete
MTFWLNDPTILFNKNTLTNIIPNSNDIEYNLNAITRLMIYTTLIMYIIYKNIAVIYILIISITIILLTYNKYNKNEEYTNYISKLDEENNNPFQNKILNNIPDTQPLKKIIEPDSSYGKTTSYEVEYNNEIKNKIYNNVKNIIKKNNSDNSDIHKIFSNLVDLKDFDNHMRQFYIQPTDNDLSEFLNYCYGTLPSNKSIISY